MRIIPPDELRRNISVNLAVMPQWAKRETGIGPMARDKALDAIMAAMAGWVVVAPSMALDRIGVMQAGKFGTTEPHSFPVLTGDGQR